MLGARPLAPRSESQLRGAAFRASLLGAGGAEAEGGECSRQTYGGDAACAVVLSPFPSLSLSFLTCEMGCPCPSLSGCQTPENALG